MSQSKINNTRILILSGLALPIALILYFGLFSGSLKDSQSHGTIKAKENLTSSQAQGNRSADPASPRTLTVAAPVMTRNGSAPKDGSYQHAIELLDSGDWRGAEEVLLGLLTADPSNPHVLNDLIIIASIDKKNYAEAMHYCERLLNAHPDYPSLFDKYREMAALGQDFPRAIAFLKRRWLEDGRGDYRVPMALARLNHEQKHYAEAVKNYRLALTLDSKERGKLNELLGSALEHLNDFQSAQDALEKAVAAYTNYNETYSKQNRMDYQSSLNAEHSLARIYVKNRSYEKADTLIVRLLKKDPQTNALLVLKEKVARGLKQPSN